MNKVFNINLGGYPFVIDDVAYDKLDEYLISLEEYFSDSEGCEEIVSEVSKIRFGYAWFLCWLFSDLVQV